ncbi:MAG: glycosyltransferase family 9 protein [Proteobacteria bacterium]|nr:glycosyltransferase family 9 protein [Pseudomonadota bacterium]MBU4260064.1 glycosyltransferase family 9 protein [Pseudomonadota bacterium]
MQRELIFSKSPRKILIIKPSSLGDIVHSLPFLDAVKRRFPEAQIHWVVARGLHTFLEDHPLIDRLWIFDKDRWKRFCNLKNTIREIAGFFWAVKSQNFDVSVDLSGLLRSGLIIMASGARYKLGFKESDEGSPLFYTHKIVGGVEIHAIDRYLKIAAFMGCDSDSIRYPFAPFPENPAICRNLPSEYIVMAPSAGKDANRWPSDRFGQLAAKLPLPVVVISSSADVPIAQHVLSYSEGNAISIAGQTTLKELIAVIRKARFFISNDTGPMHIAAACEVPVFAIFGPANPIRTGPYGAIHTVIQEDLDCAPCYRRKACDDWKCMNNLTVDKVFNTIRDKIGEIFTFSSENRST